MHNQDQNKKDNVFIHKAIIAENEQQQVAIMIEEAKS